MDSDYDLEIAVIRSHFGKPHDCSGGMGCLTYKRGEIHILPGDPWRWYRSIGARGAKTEEKFFGSFEECLTACQKLIRRKRK